MVLMVINWFLNAWGINSMEWLNVIISDYTLVIMLFIAGALAGFVDSIVGGGGLISVPAMLLTNVPPSVALGSNKLGSIFGAASASIAFIRKSMVDRSLVTRLLPFTFIGSMLGTLLVISIPPLYLKPIIILLLIGVMIFVLKNKDWGSVSTYEKATGMTLYICMAVAFALGLYDGFIGPGTGTFLIMGFIFAGFDFVHASGNAKVLNFFSNLASLIVFIALGHVNFLFGLSAAAGQIIGATIGARLAIAKGSSLVRGVFVSVTSCMLIKLVYDYVMTHM